MTDLTILFESDNLTHIALYQIYSWKRKIK